LVVTAPHWLRSPPVPILLLPYSSPSPSRKIAREEQFCFSRVPLRGAAPQVHTTSSTGEEEADTRRTAEVPGRWGEVKEAVGGASAPFSTGSRPTTVTTGGYQASECPPVILLDSADWIIP
jgi:hypothetical protein